MRQIKIENLTGLIPILNRQEMFILFAYDEYYPQGGKNDIIRSFTDFNQAKTWMSENVAKSPANHCWQTFQTFRINCSHMGLGDDYKRDYDNCELYDVAHATCISLDFLYCYTSS
jgi:hypothetical protein